MNIKSRFPRNCTWLDIIIESFGVKVEYTVSTKKEAETIKEQLLQVINDLDTLI